MTKAARLIGMFTASVERQPKSTTMTPLKAGPTDVLIWVAIVTRLSAPVGIAAPSLTRRSSAIAAGKPADVPKPSKTRAAMSQPSEGASAPQQAAIAATHRPTSMVRRAPNRSTHFPSGVCATALER